MTDSQTRLILLAVGILCLLAVLYLMNRKPAGTKASGPVVVLPPLGPIGRIFLWAKWFFLAGMVVAMAAGIILNRDIYLTYAAFSLILYVIANRIGIVFRVSGK